MSQQKEKEAEDKRMERWREEVEDDAAHRNARRKMQEKERAQRRRKRAREVPPKGGEEAATTVAAEATIIKHSLSAVYSQHRERHLPPIALTCHIPMCILPY